MIISPSQVFPSLTVMLLERAKKSEAALDAILAAWDADGGSHALRSSQAMVRAIHAAREVRGG